MSGVYCSCDGGAMKKVYLSDNGWSISKVYHCSNCNAEVTVIE